VLLLTAGLSVFIALWSAVRERRADLAMLRMLGAPPARVGALLLCEALWLALLASALGLMGAHGLTAVAGWLLQGEKSLAVEPNPDLAIALIQNLNRAGKGDEARSATAKWLKRFPDHAGLRVVHAEQLMLQGADEQAIAALLDASPLVRWWHRNVARTQYGLQGWRRHKVYPDFVFAQVNGPAASAQLVVLETKGLHLAGSTDTGYKQNLLQRLTQAYADAQLSRVGELELVGEAQALVCDLVFDEAWRSTLDARYFQAAPG